VQSEAVLAATGDMLLEKLLHSSLLDAGKTAEEAKQLVCAAETQKILRGFLAGATLAGTANLLGRVLSKGKTGKTEIDKTENGPIMYYEGKEYPLKKYLHIYLTKTEKLREFRIDEYYKKFTK